MYYKDYINNFREYNSYEDFYQHYELNVPDEFNFAYDVVERAGLEFPDREALVWHDQEDVKRFTFADLSKASSRTAHYFKSLGINKGDAVMVMLKNRYEFWFCLLALHRIGAIAVPATHMLTKKDILYRNTKASIKAIVSIHDERLLQAVDETMEVSDSLKIRVLIEGQREGWSNLHEGIKGMSEVFERPTGVNRIKNEDTMLLYFTSGTTGDPKMVEHCFTYPLGHITTARYWHRVIDGGLHYTLADTGWAKAVWGKIYGQWLCGSAVFVAEYKKFTPTDVLVDIQKFGVTTFCAPPTIYRFLIQNGLREYDLSSLKHCTVAGEPLSAVVFSKFKGYTGIELCEAYGQTEVTVVSGTFRVLRLSLVLWVKQLPAMNCFWWMRTMNLLK
ncbi:AMP-binding protein [Saccharicrinis fermentans]|uniref:Acetyl-coenzyme A synthetase n=1 Tax=Saccharicrinis fermentans DSM 9555 = JCM 21142 TaxID=869213 RepID=W7XZT2_9BACT|nr:AMP-binding protein [Saccharicrinis fermentans]GAF04160.1 acetyl-coenzyme A synthetase [Saccharicrinis fermentans DSM 9555 = JCM 21142]